MVCNSVLEELNHVDEYGEERYTFEIMYDWTVRFKIEQFATGVDVYINTDDKVINTTFHFEKQPDPYNPKSMPFINELKKLLGDNSEYFISAN